MKLPEEFKELCGYIDGFSYIDEFSPQQWITSAVKQFREVYPEQKHENAVVQYLDDLLGGKYDDVGLQQVWSRTSVGFGFRDANELRAFLTMIRDTIKERT